MTTLEKFRKIILANELGGDAALAFEFSDPDGVRSGKSGWSFGICQFDLSNNPTAAKCLRACGFTDDEIIALKEQTVDVKPFAQRLRAAAGVIEEYDRFQLSGCLYRAENTCRLFGIKEADETAILALADYDNQYHFSGENKPGYLVHFLLELGRPFTADDILHWKVDHTKYGREHTNDCLRRYRNVVQVATDTGSVVN